MHDNHDIDAQVHALLGGDRLAARAPSAPRPPSPRPETSRWSIGRVAVGATLAGLAVFSTVVISYGLQRRSEARADQVATELQTFANTGGAEQASELLHELAALPAARRDPAHRGIVVLAEASLYRAFDADPERRQHIEAELQAPDRLPEAEEVIARAQLASRADRLSLLSRLAELSKTSEDPAVPYLMATALSRAGSVAPADAAYDRALELEPSSLEHLAGFAAHQFDTGRAPEAKELLDVMLEVDPSSGWTRQVAAMLGAELPEPETLQAVPVAEAWAMMRLALQKLAVNDLVAARDLISRAVQRVNAQPAFLVDFADLLIDADRAEAAGQIIEHAAWAHDSAGAKAAEGRRLLAQGKANEAAKVLAEAVGSGFADPVTGLAYLDALSATGGKAAAVRKLARELASAWPDHADVAKAIRAGDRRDRPARKKKKRRRRRRKRARRR